MSEYESPYRNRVYKRKFDHDEARRRWLNGETLTALANDYAVTLTAVKRAVDVTTCVRMDLNTKAYYDRNGGNKSNYDTCSCGNPKRKGAKQCASCYNATLPQQISPDGLLWCPVCKTHRPTTEFPFDPKVPSRNFRRRYCRSCDTKARQDYRERHKVPCVYCGAPALPESEKGKRGHSDPRCRDCWRKGLGATSDA